MNPRNTLSFAQQPPPKTRGTHATTGLFDAVRKGPCVSNKPIKNQIQPAKQSKTPGVTYAISFRLPFCVSCPTLHDSTLCYLLSPTHRKMSTTASANAAAVARSTKGQA